MDCVYTESTVWYSDDTGRYSPSHGPHLKSRMNIAKQAPGADPHPVKVLVIGSGFGGLAAGIRLKQAGEHSFLILERESDVGGVWRDNGYPGCACDVQSNLYSFSFAPNPAWSRHFSPQGEIHAYLRQCVQDFGLAPHLRLQHEVTRMDWREDRGLWEVQTNHGVFWANAVIGGFGSLSDPAIPSLKGLSSFKGQVFHSANWPRDFRHQGRRVAVVGTGASAIQFIPAIQPHVNKLHVFQRTAPWVMPRHDGPVSEGTRSVYAKLPWLQKLARLRTYVQRESFVLGFRHPAIMKIKQRTALAHLNAAVQDADLRAKLTPDYTLGCKRILISNTYYPAMAQQNVEVIASGIREVVPQGVVGDDGRLREVDAIIFGTGFQTKDLPFSHLIFNAQGESLNQHWAGNPRAYMGTSLHGFPNLFLLHGPNIGLGHTSVVIMLEAQVEHILKVLGLMRERAHDVIEPTAKAQKRFVDEMEQRIQGTVWTAGKCESWYLDATGKASSLWPTFTFSFMRRASRVRGQDYQSRRVPAQQPQRAA